MAAPLGHTVLASTDGAVFASLRHEAMSRAERYVIGRELRRQVPRSALATWTEDDRAADPVQQVIAANEGRLERLVPVRVGRMVASPYAFLRGAAAHHGRRLRPPARHRHHPGRSAATRTWATSASTPRRSASSSSTSTTSTRRTPAPGSGTCAGWWPACRWPAGRTASEDACGDAVRHCVRRYREHLAHLAEQPLLARSFDRLDVDRLRRRRPRAPASRTRSSAPPAGPAGAPATARSPGSPSSTTAPRLVEEPPLITRPEPGERSGSPRRWTAT